MSIKAITAGLVVAAATSFVAPSSAQATQPVELGSYADSWREDGTYCGRDERVDVAAVGHVVVRQGPAGAPELYVHDNYLVTYHHIGPDGSWWTRLNGNFRVASIDQVGPTTWRIVQQDAGRNWNLTSESGTSVWADRGVVRFTFEVDTLGDDDRVPWTSHCGELPAGKRSVRLRRRSARSRLTSAAYVIVLASRADRLLLAPWELVGPLARGEIAPDERARELECTVGGS